MTEDFFSSVKKVYPFIYCLFQIMKEVYILVTIIVLFFYTDAENRCSSVVEKIFGVNLQNISIRTAASARTILKTSSS